MAVNGGFELRDSPSAGGGGGGGGGFAQGLGGIGDIFSGITSFMQADQTQIVASRNAGMILRNIEIERVGLAFRLDDLDRRAAMIEGTQTAMRGASGVEVHTGSAVDTVLDVRRALGRAQFREVFNFDQFSKTSVFQANMIRHTAQRQATLQRAGGIFKIGTGLLKTASGVGAFG